MKKQKQILARLMALNNEQVDKNLFEFADGIVARIKQSATNETRLEELELLKEFVYKVPEQALLVTHYILEHPLVGQQIEIGELLLPGKSHDEVVFSALDLLNEIRYIDADGVLPILQELARSSNQRYKQKALEILQRLARYDYNVFTKSKIGYGAQRKTLDFILAIPREKRIENFDFIEVIARAILSTSVEGTTATAVDTLTFHSGVVQITPFLKKMRRETIESLFDLYSLAKTESHKIAILKALEEAVRGPSHVAYSDEVVNMLLADYGVLLKWFRSTLFDAKGKIKISLAIAEEIETRLYWWTKHGDFNTEEACRLRTDILSDESYHTYHLFMGDDLKYREESVESDRNLEMDRLFDTISKENLATWTANLNMIADQLGAVEEWKFLNFKMFLRRLAGEKPEIAKTILDDAYAKHNNLIKFSGVFLDGFRDADRFDLWDNIVLKIVALRDGRLASAIAFSLNYDKEVELVDKIRDSDLKVLSEMAGGVDRFAFLHQDEEKNPNLHYALINTLLRNFKRDPALLERLILDEILNYPAYARIFTQAMMLARMKNWVDFSQLSDTGAVKFKAWLIGLPDIDWEIQDVLADLGKNNLQTILHVFLGRIEREVKHKEESKLLIDPEHYDAIPHDLNESLRNRIGNDPDYRRLISPWLDRLTSDWSIYNWDVAEFISRIGISSRGIVMELIEKGDDDSLKKATHFLDRIHGGEDIEFCMEIVKRTDNKAVLSTIESALFSTGVVSGEYGIALTYERKAQAFDPYLSSENARVKKFCTRIKERLLASAAAERKRVDEWKRLRKTEFEG